MLSNLQIILLGILIFIDVILFHWGGFILALARGEIEKMEKGRRILAIAFVLLFIILVIIIVFYLANYFLKGKEPVSPGVLEEFPPPLHIGAFPPSLDFIKIGRYYFRGPWPLKDVRTISGPVFYAILCKKNEQYDIMYINEASAKTDLLRHNQYRCWIENCEEDLSRFYLAIFQIPERYDFEQREKIKNSLTSQLQLPCFEKSNE